MSLGGPTKRNGRNKEYCRPPVLVEYLLLGPNPSPTQAPEISQPIEVGMIRVDDGVMGKTTTDGKPKGPLLCVGVVLPDGTVRVLNALLDTGAQCNLIQMGILSPEMFQNASNPLRLVTATGAPLTDGTQEVVTYLLFHA